MLGSVFTKTIRDRWKGWLIAVASLALLFLLAMSVYRDIDIGIYDELPEVYRSMLGIPVGADVGSLAISALIASYGAMTVAAMALAMGSGAIAGEERAGTIGLLLANPKSRTHVLAAKLAALALLTAGAVGGLWAAIVLVSRVLGVSIEGMHVGALSLHLLVSSLVYGLLAAAVGAWTGRRGAAVRLAVGVMVVSFVAVGVLPLLEGAEEYVKAFPWYYFNGSDPLLNGVSWGHVGILAAASAILTGVAVIGVNRRDLREHSTGAAPLARLRASRVAGKLLGRLSGSTRVSSIWAKTASDYRALLLIASLYIFVVQGVLLGPLYAAIPDGMFQAWAEFPEGMIALFGGGDITTPEGFYQIETFGMMAPIVVMIVTIAVGAEALAGEESRRTMGLLLANPVSRSRVVAEKAGTMTLFSFFIGLVTFAGVALGSALGDLGIDMGDIAATCLLQTLVGLAFGALALALSAATGSTRVAIFGAAGAGIALHLLNGFSMVNESLTGWAKLSPFYYYLGGDPLVNGMSWGHGAVLVAICAALVGASFALFQRRDIRQTG